jgi:hypothetical protein
MTDEPSSDHPVWEDESSQQPTAGQPQQPAPQQPAPPPEQQPPPRTPAQEPPAQQPPPPPPQPAQQPPPQPAEQQPSAQPAPAQQPPPQAAQAMPDVQPLPPPQPKVPFPLQQGEQVIRLVRRHWWFLWPYTVWLFIVALAPVAVAYWFFDLIGIADDLDLFFWIPALLWIGYWLFRAAFNWYRYQNDIWVVTNQRLIDVFRTNPFNKRVTTADLVNIQDMRVERHGITATVLGYSDLLCSTAGTEGGTFNISGVPNAEELQLLIDKERDRERMRRA